MNARISASQRSPSVPSARDRSGELFDLQRWMLDTITHPDGLAAGTDATARATDSAFAGRPPHAVIRRSKNLTSRARIEIYANMYYWRLQDCLAADFPAVQHALGEELFATVARAYLVAHPSRHYNLNQLGKNFPAYLQLRTDLPQRRFLADLAALERAVEEAFDAPETPPVQRSALRRVPPECWADARLETVAAFRLTASVYPVNAYLEAVRNEKLPVLPKRGRSWTAVVRRSFKLRRLELTQAEFTLLKQLARGFSVGQALKSCLLVPGIDPQTFAASVAQSFERWAACGVFAAVRLPNGRS